MEARFQYRRMLDDPFVLVAPAGSDIAGRASVTVDEVTALPLISYRDAVCSTLIEQIFRYGDPPTFVFRSDDNPTIQGCVASGIGYWATPLLTVDTDDPAVTVIPIEPAPDAAPHRAGLAGEPALVPGRRRARGRGRGRRWSADVPSTGLEPVAYRLGERCLFAMCALVGEFAHSCRFGSSHARPASQHTRDAKRLPREDHERRCG